MEIPVIYQDDTLLICEKPAGVPSESPGLPDLVTLQTGMKVFPVHRLDQGTGGVIILACASDICSRLQKMFQSGLVKKEYLAVVSGILPSAEGVFEDNLFHDRKTNKTFIVKRQRAGVKKASCTWTSLQTVLSEQNSLTLVRIQLHTGRTHQIRVQFASRKCPLVGDRKYGSRISADYPALWSETITFPHPLISGATVNASSSPPRVYPWNLFSEDLLQM